MGEEKARLFFPGSEEAILLVSPLFSTAHRSVSMGFSPVVPSTLFVPLFLSFLCPGARAGARELRLYEVSTGFHLRLDPGKGRFEIATSGPDLRFRGGLGRPLEGAGTREGKDGIGPFKAAFFSWWEGVSRRGEIRIYRDRKVVLFLESWPAGAERPASSFPSFDGFPGGFFSFCYRDRSFSPPRFGLEETSSPWFFFKEDGTSFLVSPASRFMVSEMKGDGKTRIVSGLGRELMELPPGYDHATILAVGKGVNRTWNTWGNALTDYQGKRRPGPYADVGLRCLGYWTDNGAAYYYNFDPKKGYEKTLLDVMKGFRDEGIPYRYLQLDSWFYPKTFTNWDLKKPAHPKPKNPRLPAGRWNRYGGMLLYEGDPGVFPRGLGEFHKKLGLPLVTHNRWIDPESPYRKSYKISGVGAVDPAWWDHVIGNIASWGVVTYEQDWLNIIYGRSPEMRSTAWAGAAFMDQMARACREKGLTMQYCMAQPRHFLQGSRYENLTTIRVSGDRFSPRAWKHALFTSRLAWSVGIYPWVDVFRSAETANLLLACLSAGMVGPGDRAGEESVDNLARAARSDGVLVKPDAPILPVNESWTAQARRKGGKGPIVAATYTEFQGFKAWYVFVWNPTGKPVLVDVPPASLGIEGRCRVQRPFLGVGHWAEPGRPWRARVEARGKGSRSWGYFVVVPRLGKGLAFLGDKGKFVPLGRKRIKNIVYKDGKLRVEVAFAKGENEIVLEGYSLFRPAPVMQEGSLKSVGWHGGGQGSNRFLMVVGPGPKGRALFTIPCR